MTSIIFLTADGASIPVDALNGHSAMEAAIRNNIPGIDGECGGVCACATCHVQVEEPWSSKLETKTEAEKMMLEFASGVGDNSRLACQIKVEPAFEGMVLRVVER